MHDAWLPIRVGWRVGAEPWVKPGDLGNATEAQASDFQYVYDNVLRPFDLVYRGMSCGVFDLGNADSVRAHASSIESLTNLDNFESPLYMPVTRDLSKGRRRLLMRYLGLDDPPVA